MKKFIASFIGLALTASGCYASQIEKVIEKADKKTVRIGIVSGRHVGGCSGAIISDEGVILTCAHCFEHHPDKIFVKSYMKKVFQANLILIDADRDLALIAPIAHQGVFEYFRIGKKPKIGQQVISLGSPLGIPRVASVGYIEAYLEDNYVYILHSAFINPGNSGGPLVSLDGKLIGINEATLNIDVIHAAQGMFIAISLYTIYDFLRRIQ